MLQFFLSFCGRHDFQPDKRFVRQGSLALRHGALQQQEMKAGLAQAKSCFVYVKPEKFMLHMHDIIQYLFDCWADPVAHLLLPKRSMLRLVAFIGVTIPQAISPKATVYISSTKHYLQYTIKIINLKVFKQLTGLICKAKYHCMDDLQFYWFGFQQLCTC